MKNNKILKRFYVGTLICVMISTLFGCGNAPISQGDNIVGGDNGNQVAKSINNNSENNNNSDNIDFKAYEIDPDKYIDLVSESSSDEAQSYLEDMKIGWNLGNTFDTVDDKGEIQGAGLTLETKWCGVYTTRELIDKVKGEGFNAIRIPVSWHNHLEDGSFVIAVRWLDRIQQIVDYAYENDMYVILNIHHDVDKKYYYPDSDHEDSSTEYLNAIWLQLAERFKDYDEKLIFESINEPRLVGHNNEWWIDENKPDCIDSIETINRLNQVFVDCVRSTGGNNVNRYLLIPGYDTSADGALNDSFKLPNDIASNKLIVTVHAYIPFDLALDLKGKATFGDDDKAYIDNVMQELDDKFVSKGVPVLIGEFGIVDKNNLEVREEFTAYYVQAAKEHGIVCMWWDNNAFASGETFGLIDRGNMEVMYPGIMDALMQNSN